MEMNSYTSYTPAMPWLARFLDPTTVSLKICGVTTRDDAGQLAALGVAALGVNFWPPSKRYLAPQDAGWLLDLAGRILRVGVLGLVNSDPIKEWNGQPHLKAGPRKNPSGRETEGVSAGKPFRIGPSPRGREVAGTLPQA